MIGLVLGSQAASRSLSRGRALRPGRRRTAAIGVIGAAARSTVRNAAYGQTLISAFGWQHALVILAADGAGDVRSPLHWV